MRRDDNRSVEALFLNIQPLSAEVMTVLEYRMHSVNSWNCLNVLVLREQKKYTLFKFSCKHESPTHTALHESWKEMLQ